jgi:hypothetical protein
MLWKKYPKKLDQMTLTEAYQSLGGDEQSDIPWIVWLLENPASPVALPGNIDLAGHDCLHLLLKKGFTSSSEAYVVGFTMGNDQRTKWFHFQFFKLAVLYLYPPKYRLSHSEIRILERGFKLGQRTLFKDLNQADLTKWNTKTLEQLRSDLGLELTGDLNDALSTFLSSALTGDLSVNLSAELSLTINKVTQETVSEMWAEILNLPEKGTVHPPITDEPYSPLSWPTESLSEVWIEAFGKTDNQSKVEPMVKCNNTIPNEPKKESVNSFHPDNETLSEAWVEALNTITI